jgi:O-antigen ligase
MILLYGLAFLPLLGLYIYYLSRSVLLGWISLLGLQLYIHTFGIDPFDIGPLHIDVFDILELCLLAAGIIRTIPRLRERDTARMFTVVYLAIFAFSLGRGIIAHGVPAAGNGSRILVGFLIASLYFLTAPVDSNSMRRYVRVFLYYGLGLAFVAFLAYAGLDVGMVAQINHDLTAEQLEGRLLPSDSGLALALCFFFSLSASYHRNTETLSKWLPAVFLGLAVFLRHRTVWAVLATGLIFLFFMDRGLFRRMIPVGVFALCLMAGYALLAGNTTKSFETQLSDSSTDERTWVWRVVGWEQLLQDEQPTVTNVLFGRGLGSGYERFDITSGRYIDYLPHNEYITQFLNLGIAGLVLVLCFMIRPLWRFWRLSSSDMRAVEPSTSAWAVVAIGIMVFSVAYDPSPEAYALLGIANAMVSRLDKDAITATAAIR